MQTFDRLLVSLRHLWRTLLPPVFPTDDEKTRQARVLYTVIVAISLNMLVASVLAALFAQNKILSELLIFTTLLFLLMIYRLLHQGQVRLASLFCVIFAWSIVSAVVYVSGGATSVSASLYLIAIALAVLLLGARASLLVAGASLTYTLVLFLMIHTGHQPPVLLPMQGIAPWLVFGYATVHILISVLTMQAELGKALQVANERLVEWEESEVALRESESRFRFISSVTSDYTFASRVGLNGELDHTLLTGAFETITGYTPEEYKVIGGWRSIVHPDDRERDTVNMETLLRNQSSVAEIRIVNKSSETRWVRVYAHPVWDDAANRLIEINGAVQDITARRRAEDALRESETRLRALLDATTDVAFLITRTGTFLTLNKAFADTLGKSVEELVGENCFELMPPDLKERRISYFEAAAESQEAVRWQDETSGGWWDNSVYPMISAGGTVEAFAVYSRDITEQRRLAAELKLYTDQLQQMVEERTAQLRRAKDQIELILNHTKDAVALADTNGHIRTRNPAFVALFGERVSESLDQILWAVKGNDQGASVGAALMNALSGQSQPRLSTQITAQDGEERDLDMAFIPVLLADETERLGVLVSAHDITHLKEIERFKARFITDAFHDLATPITALTTRLYLLKNKPERLDEHVRALENQVDHLHDLLVDLRTLAQFDRGQIVLNLQPANLNQIVARVFDTYESIAISKKQNLTLTVDASLPDTRLDHRQIERVLINLISNAIHYTPEDKKIELKTVYKDDYIIFEVADEGIGIAAEDLTHVFERFYRSQLARETRTGGTGLGLAIVKEIVELHGGTVSATSELEHGSTFIMRLPVQS